MFIVHAMQFLRMFPKYNFDDSLTAIERLGRKREVNVHMGRYRLDQLKEDERILSDEDEAADLNKEQLNEDVPMDEFEALIDEQIALTTVQSRTNASALDKSFDNMLSSSNSTQFTHNVSSSTQISQPSTSLQNVDQSSHMKNQQSVVSQAEPEQSAPAISDEVRARIAENKKRALEKLEQRKKEAEEMKAAEEREKLKAKEAEPKNMISKIIDDDDDF